MTPNQLTPNNGLKFILAGKALFTVRSEKTGTRYTYKVVRAEEGKAFWFVSVLTGPVNTSDYTYLGVISGNVFKLTGKSKMKADSTPVVAFKWVLSGLFKGELKGVELWHEGRCGRCGRVLTVPSSIEQGFGPECIGLVGGTAGERPSVQVNRVSTGLLSQVVAVTQQQQELAFMAGIRAEEALG